MATEYNEAIINDIMDILLPMPKNQGSYYSRVELARYQAKQAILQWVADEVKSKQVEAYKEGLLTGAMPEAIGKPIAVEYLKQHGWEDKEEI